MMSLDTEMTLVAPAASVQPPVDTTSAVERLARGYAGVTDASAGLRRDRSGEVHVVLHVVGSDDGIVGLQQALAQAFAPPPLLLRMTALPLTMDGHVDEDLLASYPIVESASRAALQDALDAAYGPDRVLLATELDRQTSVVPVVPVPLAASDIAPEPDAPPARCQGLPGDPSWGHQCLPDLLVHAAATAPHHAIHFLENGQASRITYAELLDEARRVVHGLHEAGVPTGHPVLLCCRDNRSFVGAFWGCTLAGMSVVPLACPQATPDPAAQRLLGACQLFPGAALVTDEAARQDVCAIAGNLPALLTVEALRRGSGDIVPPRPAATDIALLLLTSGSTGAPKAVVQTHRNLVRQVHGAAAALTLGSDDISLNWFPLDHVGGLVMFHLRDVATACTQIQVPVGDIVGQPLRWIELVSRFRASITWAPNFGYALVNAALDKQAALDADTPLPDWDLGCVRVFMNGGEAINRNTADGFLRRMAPFGLRPGTMHPAWGMSETCSGVTYGVFDPGQQDDSVDVGRPIAGIALRIVDEQDALLPEGQCGRLQVRGDTVTPGYHANAHANAEAFTSDGWFITGDAGMLKDGVLTILGRTKDTVIVNGLNFYCQELEDTAEAVQGVRPTCVVVYSLRPPGGQEELVVFLSLEASAGTPLQVMSEVRQALLKFHSLSPEQILVIDPASFPRTSIGKHQRSALAGLLNDNALQVIHRQGRSSHLRPSEDALPGWFVHVRQQPRLARPSAPAEPWNVTLLFGHETPACRALAMRLGGRCVLVTQGATFQRLSEDWFELNPGAEGDVAGLFDALHADGIEVDGVLHLWSHGPRPSAPEERTTLQEGLASGHDSIIRITREWRVPEGQARALVVGTSGVYRTRHPYPERAGLMMLTHRLGKEHAGIHYRHVDFSSDLLDPLQTDALLAEIREGTFVESVYYEDGLRCVSVLEPGAGVRDDAPFPLQRGATVLITGGLGGIGQQLCVHLHARHGLRSIILGRRTEADAQATLAELRARGCEVEYIACDLDAPGDLQKALTDVEVNTGTRISGVFHLAGIYAPGKLMTSTTSTAARQLGAKLFGLARLEQAFASRPEVFFVNFSSAVTLLGGEGNGPYALANGSVEAYTCQQREHRRAWSIAWGIWDGSGMAAQLTTRALMLRHGYCAMRIEQALASLDHILGHRPGHVHAGVDLDNAALQARLPAQARPWDVQIARLGEGVQLRAEDMEQIAPLLQDRFGTPFALVPRPLVESDTGTAGSEQAHKDVSEPPRLGVETTLADIWAVTLGAAQPGRTDNFFELGGSSLLAAELLVAVEARLQVRLTFFQLMTMPTIAEMAAHIEGTQQEGRHPCLVSLQTRGTRTPFFGVHPLFGLVYPYAALARELGPEQPFHALQSRCYLPGGLPHASIEEMAREYLDAVRTIQPHGPYQLGGWSFGSLIALEMARQLTRDGEEIACLVIIDQATDSLERFFDEVPVALKLSRFFTIVGNAMRSFDPWYAAHPGPWKALRRPWLLQRFVRGVLLPMIRIGMANTAIARQYVLGSYPGRIVLLHTGDPEFTRLTSDDLGWSAYAEGGVESHRIDGTHLNLHEQPYVKTLAAKLSAVLGDDRG